MDSGNVEALAPPVFSGGSFCIDVFLRRGIAMAGPSCAYAKPGRDDTGFWSIVAAFDVAAVARRPLS
jgi:hypothetical protein